jgi:hypothetical protein
MDTIEFENEPTLRDFRGAAMKRLLSLRNFRRYLLVVTSIFVLLVIIAQVWDFSEYEKLMAGLGLLCVIALVAPFAFPKAAARRAFMQSKKDGPMVFRLDEQGYGGKSDVYQFYIKWQGVDAIYETEKYVFMELKRGSCLIIFKRLLPNETVFSIRELIAAAPVPKKELLVQG